MRHTSVFFHYLCLCGTKADFLEGRVMPTADYFLVVKFLAILFNLIKLDTQRAKNLVFDQLFANLMKLSVKIKNQVISILGSTLKD